jgi:voltage-gated potassium channel
MSEHTTTMAHTVRILALSALGLLIIGTTFYHYVEHLAWIDAYYTSVITLTTVGYGDFTPKTDIGKIFTTLYILAGVGVIASFVTAVTQRRVERRIQRVEKRKDNTQ